MFKTNYKTKFVKHENNAKFVFLEITFKIFLYICQIQTKLTYKCQLKLFLYQNREKIKHRSIVYISPGIPTYSFDFWSFLLIKSAIISLLVVVGIKVKHIVLSNCSFKIVLSNKIQKHISKFFLKTVILMYTGTLNSYKYLLYYVSFLISIIVICIYIFKD